MERRQKCNKLEDKKTVSISSLIIQLISNFESKLRFVTLKITCVLLALSEKHG